MKNISYIGFLKDVSNKLFLNEHFEVIESLDFFNKSLYKFIIERKFILLHRDTFGREVEMFSYRTLDKNLNETIIKIGGVKLKIDKDIYNNRTSLRGDDLQNFCNTWQVQISFQIQDNYGITKQGQIFHNKEKDLFDSSNQICSLISLATKIESVGWYDLILSVKNSQDIKHIQECLDTI